MEAGATIRIGLIYHECFPKGSNSQLCTVVVGVRLTQGL